MSILVGDEAGNNSACGHGIAERGAKTADQRFPAATPRQQEASRIRVTLRTQGEQAADNLTDKGIHRNQTFCFEFAEGHEDGPLVRPEEAQAIGRQVDALADAHASVALQQEQIAGKIVAAGKFLLNPLVLIRQQRTWECLLTARDVFAGEQTSQGGDLLSPSQFFQQAV